MQHSNNHFKTYANLMSFLDKLGLFHMDFSLKRMHTAISELIPQTNMHIVQIIGTNGKGSTASFLSSIGIEHKLKTGLFTSPHFISPRERILINNNMLSEQDYTYFANKIYDKIQTLTYFEFLTVLAYLAFHESKVNLAIMEAGLGGQHDATTALPVHTLCYTPVAMDHQNILGDSLQKIGTEKSLAIRSNAPIITAQQQDIVLDCLKVTASKFTAPLHIVDKSAKDKSRLNLNLQGEYQQENACLALKTWQEVAWQNNWQNKSELTLKGLENAFIAGRMQYIPAHADYPALLLDGAHNYHGLSSLTKALVENNYVIKGIIFSCMEDKDSKELSKLINIISQNKPVLVPPIPNIQRAENNEFLATLIGKNAITVPSLQVALEHFATLKNSQEHLDSVAEANILQKNAPKSIILICGSLYLLAEFFKLYPEHLQKTLKK